MARNDRQTYRSANPGPGRDDETYYNPGPGQPEEPNTGQTGTGQAPPSPTPGASRSSANPDPASRNNPFDGYYGFDRGFSNAYQHALQSAGINTLGGPGGRYAGGDAGRAEDQFLLSMLAGLLGNAGPGLSDQGVRGMQDTFTRGFIGSGGLGGPQVGLAQALQVLQKVVAAGRSNTGVAESGWDPTLVAQAQAQLQNPNDAIGMLFSAMPHMSNDAGRWLQSYLLTAGRQVQNSGANGPTDFIDGLLRVFGGSGR